jgi:class 3 adenylate cyclase
MYARNVREQHPSEIVTMVFTDVQGSTSLWENEPGMSLDNERE